MARARRRQDGIERTRRHREQVRQLRIQRHPADLSYVFTDADFVGQTISGTYYGWATSGFGTLPLRLHRYGGLISLTGTFKRLWTTNGTTPAGYSPQLYQIIDAPSIPEELQSVALNEYRVPIHHDVSASQSDLSTVYTGKINLAGAELLSISLEHVDYSLTPGVTQVPKRRTVYFYVDITVPYTPPPS